MNFIDFKQHGNSPVFMVERGGEGEGERNIQNIVYISKI